MTGSTRTQQLDIEPGMEIYVDGVWYGRVTDVTSTLVLVRKDENSIPDAFLLDTLKKLQQQKRLKVINENPEKQRFGDRNNHRVTAAANISRQIE